MLTLAISGLTPTMRYILAHCFTICNARLNTMVPINDSTFLIELVST